MVEAVMGTLLEIDKESVDQAWVRRLKCVEQRVNRLTRRAWE